MQLMRGASAGEVHGGFDMHARALDPVSRGSTHTDGHTEVVSESDDTQDEMEDGENKLGPKKTKNMKIKRPQNNGTNNDANDMFSFPGSAPGMFLRCWISFEYCFCSLIFAAWCPQACS